MRQDDSQRDQEDDLTQYSNKERNLRLPQSKEGGLNPILQTEYQHTCHEDRHHFPCKGHQLCLIGKEPGIESWQEHGSGRGEEPKAETHPNHPAVQLFDPAKIPGSVIVTDDGSHALRKAIDRRGEQLHDTLHDRQRTHMQVSSVSLQAMIQYNADKALCSVHDKRRDA